MADQRAVDQFVEELGLTWERLGANRTIGRMLGWLMVCDPPEQTAAELVDALQVSKASVSTTTRALEAMGLIERVAVPGERRVRYRMPLDAWDATARDRIHEMERLIRLARTGQRALEHEPVARRARVDRFHHWACWWHDRYLQMLDEWDREQRE